MSATVLVDTNVLVYSVDATDMGRHARAAECLAAIGPGRIGVSTQILSEFANVLTHPHKLALSARVAIETIEDVASFSEVLTVAPDTVLAALDARERWQLEYYDAQIWATAALNNVPIVLSEDFSSVTTLGGVTFVNPFEDGFDPESL